MIGRGISQIYAKGSVLNAQTVASNALVQENITVLQDSRMLPVGLDTQAAAV